MRNILIQDCKIISVPEEDKSFIITIGTNIIFMNQNAYTHSGKITSMMVEGFYMNEEDEVVFVQWNNIADILTVNNGDLLNFLEVC